MSDVTPEFIAEARRTAEYEAERFPNDDWPPIVLALLGSLDAAEREFAERARRTRIDVCSNCGDLVIADGDADYWAHYRGPGSRLNRCQHTVPYGHDATPAHDGAYFIVRDLMPRKDGE